MDKNLKYYDDAFYKQHEEWTGDYAKVSKWIYDNIGGQIFGDVGCGNAYMISNLYKTGKKVWGVDAAKNFEEYVDKKIRKFVKKVDLTVETNLDNSDVALCFEVAEHIDKKFADVLVKNIVSTNADTILFTAARPGQDGTHHINLQPPQYWLDKFKKYGYCHDVALSEKFKSDLEAGIQTTVWYLQNIIVLQKCDSHRLKDAYEISGTAITELKSRLEASESENIRLNDQVAAQERELHAIINSKRWKLASKAIKIIKK